MAPSSDPQVYQLMDQYFEHDRDPQFLYQGAEETIIKELKAWVARREEFFKEQRVLTDQLQKITREIMSSTDRIREPGYLSAMVSKRDRVTILNSEDHTECGRALYLLTTLKSRGFTWPELGCRPEADGGVCSFLGTVDETFDVHATLTTLEAREEEGRLQATKAELTAQINQKFAGVGAKLGGKFSMEEARAIVVALAERSDGKGAGQVPTGGGGPSGSSSHVAGGGVRPGR